MSEMVERVATVIAEAAPWADGQLLPIDAEKFVPSARAAVEALEPADILELMRRFSDEDRAEIMRGGGLFCRECGRDDPGCQCWNDE